MGKRPHNHSAEQLFEEQRQFILDNLPSMALKVLARRFFEKFGLKTKSTAFAALWRSLEEAGFDAQANEVKVGQKNKMCLCFIFTKRYGAKRLKLFACIIFFSLDHRIQDLDDWPSEGSEEGREAERGQRYQETQDQTGCQGRGLGRTRYSTGDEPTRS